MPQTTFDEFSELATRGNFVPVCREIWADLLTPVSAFLAIAADAEQAFLLESVEGGERVARYSFLGKDPFLVLRADHDGTVIERGRETNRSSESFLSVLRREVARRRPPPVGHLPRLTSGAVGYFGYDAARWFEPAVGRHGGVSGPSDDLATFMFFDTVLAFDHVKHRILVIANVDTDAIEDLTGAYEQAVQRIDRLEQELARPLTLATTPPTVGQATIGSNVSQPAFEDAVRSAKEAIAAGEAYQIVLSRRFDVDVSVDPFSVYRSLRHVNPSPYLYFLRTGRTTIVGSSPEMLVRVEGRRVETHPIAGTRPRGETVIEDEALETELLSSEKERAEHVMLVDLGRNDLGRICRYGTVEVTRYMEVVRYSHVMHIASTVQGELAAGRDGLDALAACFPAGTVSGAPKIRAMQLIADLETDPRGVYAGALGYLDFAGNLDFCITIRTIVIREGRASLQAGAGVVFDSDPAAEFQETADKARALLSALALAHELG